MEKPTEGLLVEAKQLIRRDFQLDELPEGETEAQLIDYLSRYITYALEYRLGYLFTALYRLDISEEKVTAILSPASAVENPSEALARLILERQYEKAETRLRYRDDDVEGDW